MPERKLGRNAAVVGAGMSRFGAFPEKAGRDLFVEAFLDMRASVDRGLDPKAIEALYMGNFSSELFEHQGQSAPIMADWVGLTPRPATRVEDACASGGVALRQGIMAIASGLHDVVLVGGVEKMTHLPIAQATDILATAADDLYETPAGFTFPGFYAAMATAYLSKFGPNLDAFMAVTIKNHQNGAANEKAHFQMTIEQVMQKARDRAASQGLVVSDWKDACDFLQDPAANPTIAYPLRLFDCSPISDGAAAVLLVAEELAGAFSDAPLYVIGSGQASDGAIHTRNGLTALNAARCAAKEAYDMAGVQPRDIKMAEVHDCFTIAEIIASEDLGFFDAGLGAAAVMSGSTLLEGSIPINTSGGLKAKGHPVGASGVAQVVEIWKQMRGEAGQRQITRDVGLALAHNVGGTGQTCAVHIFERR
jgi:acetyl-CoA C-acetyltransferase